MTKLRNIHEKKCFELLNDFINSVNVGVDNVTMKEKKEHAMAALEQLSITAGKSVSGYKPANGVRLTGDNCAVKALGC